MLWPPDAHLLARPEQLVDMAWKSGSPGCRADARRKRPSMARASCSQSRYTARAWSEVIIQRSRLVSTGKNDPGGASNTCPSRTIHGPPGSRPGCPPAALDQGGNGSRRWTRSTAR